MKLFMWFYKLHRLAEAKVAQVGELSHRKRAKWAFISGVSKAGVLLFS